MKNKTKCLSKILDKDFRYEMELDYDRQRHCREERCGHICRCSTIHNAKILSVNVQSIADEFNQLSSDIFTRYCINRAVVNQKLWETDNWDISITKGYYGEEIDSITLIRETKNKLGDTITHILSAETNKEKLFIVLKQEYGYILPELEDKEFEIRNMPVALINAGAEDHYRKLDKNIVKSYKDYVLPIGVGIIKKGEKIRLIDGYHRLSSSIEMLKEFREIIIGF